jgi:hypothetical protein
VRRTWIAAPLAIAAVVLIAVVDDRDQTPAPDQVADAKPPALLTQGRTWQLVVTADRALVMIRNSGALASVRGDASPVALSDSSSFLVPEHGGSATIVAGPVDEAATRVTVKTPQRAAVAAVPERARGLTWFWAEFPGRVAVSKIQARGGDGSVIDEFAVPRAMPPAAPIVVGRMKPG